MIEINFDRFNCRWSVSDEIEDYRHLLRSNKYNFTPQATEELEYFYSMDYPIGKLLDHLLYCDIPVKIDIMLS